LSAYSFSGLTIGPASNPENLSPSFVLSEKKPSLLPENVIPFEQVQPISRFPGSNMKSDLLDKASEIVTDPLVLVNLVSQRVKQLNSGRSPLIATRPSMGVADIALTEIIEGKIKLIQKEAP
jgi:DNA-directed RNA polymerase subunit omega